MADRAPAPDTPELRVSNALLDRAAAFAERHKKALSMLGIAWMMAVSADYAGFIGLPKIPFLTGTTGFIVAGLFNAAWWGFLRPSFERRRAAIARGAADNG